MNQMTRREMIKRHEGLRLKRYLCPAGHWSIGYGWNLDAHRLPEEIAAYFRLNGEITQLMAERLLNITISIAEVDCREIYPGFNGFTQARQVALIDFVFNVGAGTALKFRKMRHAIEAGNWQRAAEELRNSEYWKQLGGDPPGADDGRLERPEELYQMLVDG